MKTIIPIMGWHNLTPEEREHELHLLHLAGEWPDAIFSSPTFICYVPAGELNPKAFVEDARRAFFPS